MVAYIAGTELRATPAGVSAVTMYKNILVPIDGSELAEHAVASSLELASALGASVTAFVAEPLPPAPTESVHAGTYAYEADQHRARTEAHAREVLSRFAARAAEKGVAFRGEFRRVPAVDEAIVEAAAEFGCDLVVMATHGRGLFGELLFGSHTKNLLARSKLPVLVLR